MRSSARHMISSGRAWRPSRLEERLATIRCRGLHRGLNTEEELPVSKGPRASLLRAPCLLYMCRALNTGSLTYDKVLLSSKGATAARYLCIPWLLFAFQVPQGIAWYNPHLDSRSMRQMNSSGRAWCPSRLEECLATMLCRGLCRGLNTEEEVPVSKGLRAAFPRAPCLLQMCRALHTSCLTDGKVLFSSKAATAARYLCIL